MKTENIAMKMQNIAMTTQIIAMKMQCIAMLLKNIAMLLKNIAMRMQSIAMKQEYCNGFFNMAVSAFNRSVLPVQVYSHCCSPLRGRIIHLLFTMFTTYGA